MEYASRRRGVEWRQAFASGESDGPPVRSDTTDRDGTVIRVTTDQAIDAEEIVRLASVLDDSIETISIAVLLNE